jgi:hypothetical protein
MGQSQPGNSAMLSVNDPGVPALSTLRRSAEDGSLIQSSLDSDGNMSRRRLMHLSKNVAKQTDITMLRPRRAGIHDDTENVKILPGVPSQDLYSLIRAHNQPSEVSLPAVFERDVGSIGVINASIQNLLEASSFSPLAAKSAKDDDDGT